MSTSAGGNSDGDDHKRPLDLSGRINIKVKSQDGREMFFQIKRACKMGKLMNLYCAYLSLDIDSTVFLFDGHRIRPEQTPNELALEDGDEIDAMLHQMGGIRL